MGGHHELWHAITNNKVTFDAGDDSVIQTVLQVDGMGRAVRTAKTGFVNQSGSCAASMAQTPDGKEYICVTAGSTSSWRCIYDHVDIYDAFLPETAQPSESEQVTQ